jgi:predicted component of type VI protein secretion system
MSIWLVPRGEEIMRRLLLAGLASAAVAGCSSHKTSHKPGARIRDTALAAKDTTNPNDTITFMRDSVPDSRRPF